MTSSLWSSSWKHSRPWAGSWILCASAVFRKLVASNKAVVEKSIVMMLLVFSDRQEKERKKQMDSATRNVFVFDLS